MRQTNLAGVYKGCQKSVNLGVVRDGLGLGPGLWPWLHRVLRLTRLTRLDLVVVMIVVGMVVLVVAAACCYMCCCCCCCCRRC